MGNLKNFQILKKLYFRFCFFVYTNNNLRKENRTYLKQIHYFSHYRIYKFQNICLLESQTQRAEPKFYQYPALLHSDCQ